MQTSHDVMLHDFGGVTVNKLPQPCLKLKPLAYSSNPWKYRTVKCQMKEAPTCGVFLLIVFILPSQYATLQFPDNTTICLGSVAELNCSSTDAQTIFYYVNNTPAVAYSPQQGITVSAPMSIGNVTLVKLIVQGITTGVYQILCAILLTNGTFISSNVAYVAVQGPLSAPSNLAAAANGTSVKLTWGLTPDVQSSLLLYYVEVRSGSGTLLFSITVGEPQVIVNIPTTCDQYEAMVTASCGNMAVGYSSIIKFAAGSCTSYHSSTVFEATPVISVAQQSSAAVGATVGGVIGGIVILAVVFVSVLGILVCLCLRKHKTYAVKADDSVELKEGMATTRQGNDERDSPHQMFQRKNAVANKAATNLEYYYIDIKLLGHGKSGVVIKAIYNKDEQVYAIKTFKSDFEGVNDEIKALSQLQSKPGIVRYFDNWWEKPPQDWRERSLLPWTEIEKSFKVGVDGSQFLCIKLEYCAGGNLKVWLTKNPQKIDVFDIFNQLLEALLSIHEIGIFHGDLVLQNVFVALEGSVPKFKIGDFSSVVMKNAGCTDKKCDTARNYDAKRLGTILIQVIYFIQNGNFPAESKDTSVVFTEIMSNGSAMSEKPVIEFLCGKNACATGESNNADLSILKQSNAYKEWMQQRKPQI